MESYRVKEALACFSLFALSPFLVLWREPFFHLFTLSPFYF